MPRPRSAMRKVREVLRLSIGEQMSRRSVAAATGVPYTTIASCLARAAAAGIGWPVPDGIDDAELERRLYPGEPHPVATRPLPSWNHVHVELRRPGVTLQLLWLEYKAAHPDGYQYTQFVERYRDWTGHLKVVMRQHHRAGEKAFLDFAGQTVPITDPTTGEVWQAELFVAALGASSYTYAEVVPSQELPHWVQANQHAFAYFGGVPHVLVPDNLKSAVTRAHRYEPDLNRTYAEFAEHHGCAIIPARSRKPKDKAKAEAAVLLAERWILARLRNRTFFSVAEANAAVWELLLELNSRPFQKIEGSRHSLWEQLDRPALRPLPERPYEIATWRGARVNIDYHVEAKRGYCYSVPYQLAGQKCEIRTTVSTVEVFVRNKRVASHRRRRTPGYTTLPEHMPESHRRHAEWTPARIVRWAARAGDNTAALVSAVMETRPHPEQGFRACLGIMRLGKRYGTDRLDAACARALAIRSYSYRSVESILQHGLDRQPLPQDTAPTRHQHRHHEHVRGGTYYH